MPAAAVWAQATPPVLLLLLLLVVDVTVDVELTADSAAFSAEDALLTLAATWLSWESMDAEAAASAVESWALREDEAEAAEELMFANPLLNSLSRDDSIEGKAAMYEVKLLMSLTRSRGSVAGVGVICAFEEILSACPHSCIGIWYSVCANDKDRRWILDSP